ncbi:BspA family leucine-rich repeat surface protein [Flavobacterium cerinum]|uniref:BspA family leucine-rich repeat surface protein n=1 Tax=Flavobacterium cerinum TaxID=2502784 RepID=A0ABY5IUP1_9FLAO|nr:BspA family leucine-rich repeat surface protein [Flavobacterium cerinum]UUC46545.1 BspA family leucine-rich repeat surface protein [Flavobacterium cerinum]
MGTIADKLTYLGQTKSEIRDAILSKGVTVPTDTTFREYAGKIREIQAENEGEDPNVWTRPDDWLPIKHKVAVGDQKFVGLHAILEDSNFISLSATGNYTVDWGDGVVENFASGVQADHIYSYDIFPGTETTGGYRQAIVTVIPQAGHNLTGLNLQSKHRQTGLNMFYSTGWLDIKISSQYIANLIVGGTTVTHGYLEAFYLAGSNLITDYTKLFSMCRVLESVLFDDTSKGTTFSFMFESCAALKTIALPDTSKGGSFNYMFTGCNALSTILSLDTSSGVNFNYMFVGCGSLTTVPLLNTSNGIYFNNMFDSCTKLRNIPQFDTAKGIYFEYMFASCSSLKTIPLLNTANGLGFNGMFMACRSLQSIPLLNTSKGTRFSGMFFSCNNLKRVPLLDTSSGTNFGNMFEGCGSLKTVPLLNTSKGTVFVSMFMSCGSLQIIPLLDTSNGSDFSGMFLYCSILQNVPRLNVANGTKFNEMFSYCRSLSKATLRGLKNAISYENCKISHTALVDIFNNLGSGVTATTITITNNWGTSLLTAQERAIATDKGWTIIG